MKQKKVSIFLKTFLFALIILQFFTGCKKDEIGSSFPISENQKNIRELFFNTKSIKDQNILNLVADIKRQDSVFKLLPDFASKNGVPRWDKVLYKSSANKAKKSGYTLNSESNENNHTQSNSEDQGVFFIPLQSQKDSEIKSYITAYKHNDSLYTYRLYNKDSLNSIKPGSNFTKNNLLNTLAVFGYFEKDINNQDTLLINSPVKGVIKNTKIKLADDKISNTTGITTNSFPSSGSCNFSITIIIEYSLEVWTDGSSMWIIETVTQTMNITIDCDGGGGGGCGCGDWSGGGDNGGGGTYDPNWWWWYGTGYPWYSGGGGGDYDPNWYWWWTGGGGSVGGGTGFSPFVTSISNQLGLSYSQSLWLESNLERTYEIYNFLNNKIYSNLDNNDKETLAIAHINNMMTDLEYLEMVESYTASMAVAHPWMIELFKEFATEIGLKVIKKYLPGYGDWQSIKDALDDAGHGDWLGALGEVLNIVKKKVPWLAAVDAVIDVFDFGKLANKAWKAFDKIKELPTPAFNGLLKTIKEKCGDILGKIEHDNAFGSNSVQGFLRYNPTDAENFFREIAKNIGVSVNTTSAPGVFYFDVNGFRFTYYPISTGQGSLGEPTIEIRFPSGGHYKFRFRL